MIDPSLEDEPDEEMKARRAVIEELHQAARSNDLSALFAALDRVGPDEVLPVGDGVSWDSVKKWCR